ncbi:MAG: hypothetical protein ACYDA1_00150 [Vulcanimicrobiaceae bacterium]
MSTPVAPDIIAREFTNKTRAIARDIAQALAQHEAQITVGDFVYRAAWVVWGSMCEDKPRFCFAATNAIVLLRNERILNNERRNWKCEQGLTHQARDARYHDAVDGGRAYFLASFAELEAFGTELPELAAQILALGHRTTEQNERTTRRQTTIAGALLLARQIDLLTPTGKRISTTNSRYSGLRLFLGAKCSDGVCTADQTTLALIRDGYAITSTPKAWRCEHDIEHSHDELAYYETRAKHAEPIALPARETDIEGFEEDRLQLADTFRKRVNARSQHLAEQTADLAKSHAMLQQMLKPSD